MIQFFEWYLPDKGHFWKRCEAHAKELKDAGINMVWLPPAYKGASGSKSVGYDVYDMYDLGEFDQKGSIRTKYGTKDEYLKAIQAFHENGIEVIADVVLNHRLGADATEKVTVLEGNGNDRNNDVSGPIQITAWTKFDFPGRADKYSSFHWDSGFFSGTDWDEGQKRGGIFRFEGKKWSNDTDNEKGNYDYLMGADVDSDHPDVVKENLNWGKWYLDMAKLDGFRLDAVKHISFEAYRDWVIEMKQYKKEKTGKDMFVVGEYWANDFGKLMNYLDKTDRQIPLFDVPLHYNFVQAATSNGYYDMGTLFNNTIVGKDPDQAITFVDNHDTQPGQSLCSFIPAWFKPIAYAIILLRAVGTPCVFYGDYYGIPHNGVLPVEGLKIILKIRQLYAYGEEKLYFDDRDIVGFTRSGDKNHPNSGIAVLLNDSIGGKKRLYMGTQFVGCKMIDAMGKILNTVEIDANGWGEFLVSSGSLSVWVTESAYEYLYIEE